MPEMEILHVVVNKVEIYFEKIGIDDSNWSNLNAFIYGPILQSLGRTRTVVHCVRSYEIITRLTQQNMCDEVAEWLRRWTANPMCSARVGSNPILVEISFSPPKVKEG